MKGSRYKLLVHKTTTALNTDVTTHLGKGWTLYGSPVVVINETDENLWPNFAQAVLMPPAEKATCLPKS